MTDQQKKPIMRCLGEFFGNIAQGIKSQPGPKVHRTEVGRTVEEHTGEDGVILRRTTIDEVEVRESRPSEDTPS